MVVVILFVLVFLCCGGVDVVVVCDETPELRVADGNMMLTVNSQDKDIVFGNGERNFTMFGDIEPSLSALVSQNSMLSSLLGSTISAMNSISLASSTQLSSALEATSGKMSTLESQTSTGLSSAIEYTDDKVSTSLSSAVVSLSSSISGVSSVAKENTDSNESTNSMLSSAVLSLEESVSSTEESLSSIISQTADSIEGSVSLLAMSTSTRENSNEMQIADSLSMISSLKADVDGIPDFYVLSFGRVCGDDHFFTDYNERQWKIPVGSPQKTLFDSATKSGFAYFPKSSSNGMKFYLTLPEDKGIRCKLFPSEDDAIRGWHFLEATDGGNDVAGVWGVPGVPTYIVQVENPYCSPDDAVSGVCSHPSSLASCSGHAILCF
eukprot:m.4424 g.4424  ORF g.4424 m.4424 type:complete len:380 (+) comp3880_c0_seq1:20-1159(+)